MQKYNKMVLRIAVMLVGCAVGGRIQALLPIIGFSLVLLPMVLGARPLIICVDGLVGAGKTTLTTMLGERVAQSDVLYEPADRWLDVKGQGSLWQLYIQEPARWAYAIETFVPYVRLQALEEKLKQTTASVLFVDRSIYADRYCFARLLEQQKIIQPLEWAMYEQFFTWFAAHAPQPDGFIYLQAPVTLTLERMRLRGRPEEKDFPESLQEQFFQYNEDFFIAKTSMPADLKTVPVLVLDAGGDFKQYGDQVCVFIGSLKRK